MGKEIIRGWLPTLDNEPAHYQDSRMIEVWRYKKDLIKAHPRENGYDYIIVKIVRVSQ